MTATLQASRKLLALAPDSALPQPPALQFFQKLRIAVCAGYWLPSETLPDAATMASATNLPLLDIDTALSLLCEENWIARTDDGHFRITPKIDQPVSRLSNLSDMLRARGFTPGSRWIARSVTEPDLNEQWRLDLLAGARVSRLERLRLANEEIIGYERSTLPVSILPDPLQVGNSLYQYLGDNQLHIARAVEEIEAVVCDSEMAARSGLREGLPLLKLTRVSALQNGQLIELSYSFFRSDYYHYVVELND
ncbi:GntR family transcriptional regulator [Chitinilyticum piscinae]|uniref:GntR family transcriptional regulator n=1 Tax=Chitinilyticum piscinae TaxID=2866724 RepID=A0A8J7FKX0_9NEIS|nr:GntR family transcriptional regulator [Chitinilyticum piscinae]MBE9608324.1 GntR family transcriptional regulator [Chitinilyticum piscinae]